MESAFWVGEDEHLGVPSLVRPDAPRPKTWSLEAIALVERPHHPRVSPDGSRVAFTLDRDTSDVWVADISTGKASRVTSGREPAPYWEDDAATWSPDGSRLAYSAEGSVWVVPVAGGLPAEIGEGSGPQWISNEEVIYSVDREEESRLVRSRIVDGWPTPITPPGMNVAGAEIANHHQKLLFVDYPGTDRSSSNIWVHDLATGANHQLTDTPDVQDLHPCLSPGGDQVAFASERSGWREAYLVGVDGEGLKQLTNELADFSFLAWHPDGHRIAAVMSRRGVDDLVVINAASGEVTPVFSGGEWSYLGWAGDRIVAAHEGMKQAPRLVAAAIDGTVETIYESIPASIKVANFVDSMSVTFDSFDGLEIHGFLFRPEGDGPFPAIVYPHGGPTSLYGDQWDGHAQYLIEKGYAWFGINFRGSTGYGRDFERANHNVWGVADTEDCLAAADYLSGLEWVDGNRIAIFGASYGSYLALASLARDPEHRFACAVAKYGDSDIATSWAMGDRGGREDLERMMGAPADNRLAYREGSPLWQVEKIERPILVAHGELDVRVHPEQSSQLVDELKRLNKRFEYVTYPTEGHGLLRFGPQVDFYKRLERFLDWHLM